MCDTKDKKSLLSLKSGIAWEDYCMRCGRCCLEKIENSDTGAIYLTSVACRHFNFDTGLCSIYKNRFNEETGCLAVDFNNPDSMRILPEQCAYRYLLEKRPLPPWHPFIAGDSKKMEEMGLPIKDWATPWSKDLELGDFILYEI